MSKIFCITDIHGNMTIFEHMRRFMMTKDPDFKCYVLGDMIDRGPYGYQIMKILLGDPEHFIYLKGDHEELFVNAARAVQQIMQEEMWSYKDAKRNFNYIASDPDVFLWCQNGGKPTLKDWVEDGCRASIVNLIDKLPTSASYYCVDFCHAGCSKKGWSLSDESEMRWARDHFDEEWYENRILIHGHTPVKYMNEYVENVNKVYSWQPMSYANYSKICFDTAVFASNIAYVMEIEVDKDNCAVKEHIFMEGNPAIQFDKSDKED